MQESYQDFAVMYTRYVSVYSRALKGDVKKFQLHDLTAITYLAKFVEGSVQLRIMNLRHLYLSNLWKVSLWLLPSLGVASYLKS